MKTTKLIVALLAILSLAATDAAAQQLAFPGAQGWGRFAVGGRQGSVYHVTNLNDSGTGSLRDAVSQPNRIVVFDVAGVIRINSRIVFKNNLYVAGQTAPGEGITVYGNGVSFSGASNIIVRYMRFRMGKNGDSGKDCAGIANGANMIFDHCSFAWGLDETFSINPDGKGTTPENITLQNSIVGQGFLTHSAGGLMQTNYVSLVGNLLCDNSTRNFKIKGINQYANNIVYNWSNGAYIMGGDSEGKSYVNIQSNLFINGPSGGGEAFTGGNADFNCYGNDNWQDKDKDGQFNPYEITNYNAATRVATPYDYPALSLQPGKTLLTTNLPTVGASLPYRDPVDYYMVDEVMSYGKKGALISNEEPLIYGAPSTWNVWTGNQRVDTDKDGMPDEWETANGTDPAKNDAMTIAANGYANIENYINSITADDRDYFLRTPVGLEQTKATTTTMTLQWRDYTYEEQAFVVEMKKDGETYKVMATTEANATSCTVAGLEPGTKYTVRVKATAGTKNSGYTPEAAFSTRPLEVGIIDPDNYEAEIEGDKEVTVWDTDHNGWNGGTDFYEDGLNVLIDENDQAAITLNTTVTPKNVLVKGNGHVTISGTGAIAGTGSMNKAGEGTLTLNTANTYTGATVAHDGVIELNTLKNGGEASSIGASVEFAQNWIFNGGTYRYTGGNTSTNRSLKLMQTSTLDVAKSTVSISGTAEGTDVTANFIKSGNGQLTIATEKFFGYKGATVLEAGTLYLSTTAITKAGIGSSAKLVFAGGHLKTKGETSSSETYSFPIEVREGTTSQFSPNRLCKLTSTITGGGTLQWNIPYLREYIRGNWSGFSGRLIANGVSSEKTGSLLLLDSGNGNVLSKVPVTLTGNARLCSWDTNGNCSVGGVSGDAGTYIMGSSKQTKNFICSWTIGGANTDETFRGIINNWDCSSADRGGTVSITKVGTGDWRLTGANIYKGTTKVNGGRLIVNGSHTGTGAVTVASGATLAGTGSLAAPVTINNGGTLQAGDTLINAKGLTISGALYIARGAIVNIPATSTKCNKLTLSGNVTLSDGATLTLEDGVLIDAPAEGTVYQVFTLTKAISGTFTTIEPATPGLGLLWDTSLLYTKGQLKVVKDENTAIGDATLAPQTQAEHYSIGGERINRSGAKGVTVERTRDRQGNVVTTKVIK